MTQCEAIRVLLVHGYELIRIAARQVLEAEPDIRVVAEGDSPADAVAPAQRHQPDVVLLDPDRPDVDASAVVRGIRDRVPTARVVALGDRLAGERGDALLGAGASACVDLSAPARELPSVVRAVHAGYTGSRPTDPASRSAEAPQLRVPERQMEVLVLVWQGLTNREIGRRLGIAERTVESHLRRLFDLFGAGSRTELVRRAQQAGLLGDTT